MGCTQSRNGDVGLLSSSDPPGRSSKKNSNNNSNKGASAHATRTTTTTTTTGPRCRWNAKKASAGIRLHGVGSLTVSCNSSNNNNNSNNETGGGGGGIVLADRPLVQEKVQFEMKLITPGAFCVGIAGGDIELGEAASNVVQPPSSPSHPPPPPSLARQKNAWCYAYTSREEHAIWLGEEDHVDLEPLEADLRMSDIIGVTYDQDTLQVYHNGVQIPYDAPLKRKRLRGAFFPAVSVQAPAELEAIFVSEDMQYPLEAEGFSGVLVERTILQ